MPEQEEEIIVEEYETLAETYLGVSDWGSDWNTRQSLVGAATSMQALCAEVRRLRAVKDAVLEYGNDYTRSDLSEIVNEVLERKGRP